MPFSIYRLPDFQNILFPNNAIGWIGVIASFAFLAWTAWREAPEWRAWGSRQWLMIAALSVASLLAPALFVLTVPVGNALPIPGVATPSFGPSLPLFLALPWLLAAAFFGPMPAIAIALSSGLITASWDTRTIFTLIEFALIALAFSWLLKQRFRTSVFAWLRKAWVAGLALALIYPLLNVLDALLLTGADLSAALDFALSRLPWSALALSGPIVAAGFLISAIVHRFPVLLPQNAQLEPSPAEGSLQARVFSALTPIALLLFISLAAVTWIIAGQASRQSLSNQLQENAEIAAAALPFMLETGQNQILQLANDPILQSANASQLSNFLEERLQQIAYFEQLVLVDQNLATIAAFPVADLEGIQPAQLELEAINRAFNGVPVQSLSVLPFSSNSKGAQLSYIAAVANGGNTDAVLIGRSQIDSNPFAKSIIQSLDLFGDEGGVGQIWDGEGRIVYDSRGGKLLSDSGDMPPGGLSEFIDSAGNRNMRVFMPALGSNWSVFIQVPSRLTQELALTIALPQLLLIVLLGGLTFLWLRVSLARVSSSMDELVGKSRRLTRDGPISTSPLQGNDELGRLSGAIEQLRSNLMAKVDESEELAAASLAVAQDNDIHRQMDLIVAAALQKQASSARAILDDEMPDSAQEWGGGHRSKSYRNLDRQISELCGDQKRVLLTNPGRTPLDFGKQKVPAAIAVFSLKDQLGKIGHLWMTFDQAQDFEHDDIQYFEKLAEIAGLALRKYSQSKITRHSYARAQKTLAASADPIIMLNANDEIVFSNDAAAEVFETHSGKLQGKSIREIAEFAEIDLIAPATAKSVRMPGGKSFELQIVELDLDSAGLGRGVILRDTTQQKQAEALRSEFLATVSHELQDPIELLRGYLTMLDMMGELNEKQTAYTSKIADSVDNMAKLVKNLFDLERIESQLGLQLSSIEPAKLVKEVVEEIGPRAKQKQIHVDLVIDDGANSRIEADRTLIQRALVNLADNAIRHSPRGETVSVKLKGNDKRIQIVVTDRGAGIAPVDIPHVFESLSGNNAEKQARGGLGLSIVKSIIERHGGKVWAESRLGSESSFFIELPLRQDE